jgi:hypothetical protein
MLFPQMYISSMFVFLVAAVMVAQMAQVVVVVVLPLELLM